jgi:hypothetical protein
MTRVDEHSSSNNLNNQQYTNQVKFYNLSGENQIKYIENLKIEFDVLMNQKKELGALLTRIPCKKANTNLVPYRERVEEELDTVEKKISSIKLELRKLRVI